MRLNSATLLRKSRGNNMKIHSASTTTMHLIVMTRGSGNQVGTKVLLEPSVPAPLKKGVSSKWKNFPNAVPSRTSRQISLGSRIMSPMRSTSRMPKLRPLGWQTLQPRKLLRPLSFNRDCNNKRNSSIVARQDNLQTAPPLPLPQVLQLRSIGLRDSAIENSHGQRTQRTLSNSQTSL